MNKGQQLLARIGLVLGNNEDKQAGMAQAERLIHDALNEAWNACGLRMAEHFETMPKKKFDGVAVGREIRTGLGLNGRQEKRSAVPQGTTRSRAVRSAAKR